MERTLRILDKFPLFYRTWDKDSIIYNLIYALGKRIDEAEKEVAAILRSHWVDTAFKADLDKLGAIYSMGRKSREGDLEYRNRLKQGIIEFKGGGTISAIMTSVRMTLGIPRDYPIEMVENPTTDVRKEFKVNPGDVWDFTSESIIDATPAIDVSIESDNEKITNPTIKNLETEESITFNGSILKGQRLVIEEGKATLDGKSVKKDLSTTRVPRLLRKQHKWSYTEPISKEIGVFNTAVFDESKFAIGIPTIKLVFSWVSRQPATFEIRIPLEMVEMGGNVALAKEAVESIKATGVRAIVKLVEE